LSSLKERYLELAEKRTILLQEARSVERMMEELIDMGNRERFGGLSYYEYMNTIEGELEIEGVKVQLAREYVYLSYRVNDKFSLKAKGTTYMHSARLTFLGEYENPSKCVDYSYDYDIPKKYTQIAELMEKVYIGLVEKYQLITSDKLWVKVEE